MGTLNVLQAGRAIGVERIIHTSTSEVYGTALRVPIDEDHPLQGQSPYSASKIGADKLAESYHRAFNLPVVTLRPFNTYGPRQSDRAVIPTIISQGLAKGAVRLGSLETRRDFTYVSDTVDGFLKIAETPGIEGQTFNLGTGQDVSINDLVSLIFELIGKPIRVEQETGRLRPPKSEVLRLLSDNRKARQVLGWAPTVTLRDGLTQTIAWVGKHLQAYQVNQYVR